MARIVVGVDGSEGGQAALRFALDEARLRGATVHAVHAWQLPLFEGLPGPFVLELPAAATAPSLDEVGTLLEAHARGVLDEALDRELGGGEPGVEVRREVAEGSAAAVLVAAAEGADLLVVGSRGHGAIAGLVLGSVSQQCAHHARCPVAIVPLPAAGAAERGVP